LHPLTDLSDPSAYILVFHGSSDPRSRIAAEALTSRFRNGVSATPQIPWFSEEATLVGKSKTASAIPRGVDFSLPALELGDRTPPPVHAAYLECHPLPLHQQLKQIAQEIQTPNPFQKIVLRVVPVFLLPGMHVLEDIPAEIAQAQQQLEDRVILQVTTHLGSHLGLRRFGAAVAYWSMPPTLESRLQALAQSGYQRIGILPFFLFDGGITDAIAQTITQFTQHHPLLKITLTAPLGDIPGLVDLLADLARDAT
jgi:sirohydrochlorin cobaltochelatase